MKKLALSAVLCLALAAPGLAQPAASSTPAPSARESVERLRQLIEELRATMEQLRQRVAELESRAGASSADAVRLEGELAALVARQSGGRCTAAAPVKVTAEGRYLLPADPGHAEGSAVACYRDEAGARAAGHRR